MAPQASQPIDPQDPQLTTGRFLAEVARHHGERRAIFFEGREISYSELERESRNQPAYRAVPQVDIIVSVPPLASIVESIGGDKVSVSILRPPGSDPHRFEPPPSQVAQLGNAQVLFLVGMPFEKRLLEKLRTIH